MTSSISSSSSVISCAFPPVTSSIDSVMSDLLWVIGVGVIDRSLSSRQCIRAPSFSFPLHILTAVLGLLLVAVWFYYYYVFIYSSCASPFTFLKALESSSGRKSGPGHYPKCAAGH